MNYKEVKLTKEQIKQFPEFKDLSDNELEEIVDGIYDIAMVAYHIIMEKE